MNSRLLLITIAIVQCRALAYEEAPLAPAVDTSTTPAVTIDNWVPKAAPKPIAAPVSVTTPIAPPAVIPLLAPKPSVTATVTPHVSMNEMTGTIVAVDDDAKTIRLNVEGGVSVQFDYNEQTTVLSQGSNLKVSNLQSDEKVVVRYVGKDLIAQEIEVLKKSAH